MRQEDENPADRGRRGCVDAAVQREEPSGETVEFQRPRVVDVSETRAARACSISKLVQTLCGARVCGTTCTDKPWTRDERHAGPRDGFLDQHFLGDESGTVPYLWVKDRTTESYCFTCLDSKAW